MIEIDANRCRDSGKSSKRSQAPEIDEYVSKHKTKK